MLNEIKKEITTLFTKRKPDFSPDISVINAWANHLVKLDNMTLEKVKAGCQLLGGIEQRLDLGALIKAIELEAARTYNEEQKKELKQSREESKEEDRKPPLPFRLSMEYFDLTDEDERKKMRQKIVDACEVERKKHPTGSEMSILWNSAKRTWEGAVT